MLGCSTVCPKCQHQFECCSSFQACCSVRRFLSGGGLVAAALAPPAPMVYPSPQVSPSVPLAFILPNFSSRLLSSTFLEGKDITDIKILTDTLEALHQSGWFYEGISYQKGHELLKGTPVGTFLVRESSDPRFIFSLSVQTERGPTSVRICYEDYMFRLDAQLHLQPAMPAFKCVVELVQHYRKEYKLYGKNAQVWVDPHGKWYSAILLGNPLRKQAMPPSLKHFARLTINRAVEASALPKLSMLPPPHTQLELPPSLTAYLSKYPYSF